MTGLSICNHFNFTTLPFIKNARTPFIHPTFKTNSTLLQTIFYSRQIGTVTGISGSGKTALVRYSLNELEPSSHRIVTCELSNPRKKTLYKNIAIKCGIEASFVADDIKLQLIEFFNSENRQGKINCIIIFVNSKNPIYDEKCFSIIHGATKGVLGKINQLCYFSLIEAFKNNLAFVTETEIRSCIEKINWV